MSIGSYAQRRLVPSRLLVRLPEGITNAQAAAMMLKGCTVQYLLRRAYRLQAGQTILFHAAAGGCGLIACQWAKHLGATVIGTVGTPEKAELAKAHGCDHAVVYTRENFVERVKTLTNGEGVPVVFDSVGKDTFMDSLDCLQPRGMMVSFGNASGAVEPFSPGVLAAKGSLYLTRPTLANYMRTRAEIEETTTELFDVVSAGWCGSRSTSRTHSRTRRRHIAISSVARPPGSTCCSLASSGSRQAERGSMIWAPPARRFWAPAHGSAARGSR